MFTNHKINGLFFCFISSSLIAMDREPLPAASADPAGETATLAAQRERVVRHYPKILEAWLTDKETLASKALPSPLYWAPFASSMAVPERNVVVLFSIPSFVAAVNGQDPTSSFFETLSEGDLTRAIHLLGEKCRIAADLGATHMVTRFNEWITTCVVTMNYLKPRPHAQNWRKDRDILELLYRELESYSHSTSDRNSARVAVLVPALRKRLNQVTEKLKYYPAYTKLENFLERVNKYKSIPDCYALLKNATRS